MLENDDLLIQCVQRVGSVGRVGLIIKHELNWLIWNMDYS